MIEIPDLAESRNRDFFTAILAVLALGYIVGFTRMYYIINLFKKTNYRIITGATIRLS
jgi:hypothetical protein